MDGSGHIRANHRPVGRGLPRAFDVVVSGLGLVIVSPLLVACAIAVILTSTGPALFRQRRVGRNGEEFTMFKFRTMRINDEAMQVTSAEDDRITNVGRVLRKLKLDELPELWNVVKGDLSLVGPRPEVPRFVAFEDPLWQQVLRERPGITHPVTLRLVDEEGLIASAGRNPERFYVNELLPFKVRGYAAYQRERSSVEDLKVLAATGAALAGWHWYPAASLEEVREMAMAWAEW